MKKNRRTLRAFIGYSTKDRHAGAQAKAALEAIGIDAFLAHEDLQVSEEWEARIRDELERCDVFVALLSRAFRESEWAPQELGFVCGRSTVLIVPLSLDATVPFGFISHLQSRKVPADGIEVATLCDPLLRTFPRTVIPRVIQRARDARTFQNGESAVKLLAPHFRAFVQAEIDAFVATAIANYHVWGAPECWRNLLPDFVRTCRARIHPDRLRELELRIRRQGRYMAA